jgi:hypothetical protein
MKIKRQITFRGGPKDGATEELECVNGDPEIPGAIWYLDAIQYRGEIEPNGKIVFVFEKIMPITEIWREGKRLA